jgi:hypothetical protein
MVSASNPLAWGPCLSFPVRLSINDDKNLCASYPFLPHPTPLIAIRRFPPIWPSRVRVRLSRLSNRASSSKHTDVALKQFASRTRTIQNASRSLAKWAGSDEYVVSNSMRCTLCVYRYWFGFAAHAFCPITHAAPKNVRRLV